MSALKEAATQLWSKLLTAMTSDGMFAPTHVIRTSGPATTAVIVEIAQHIAQPWIGMHIKPTPGREVVAIKRDNSSLEVLCVDDESMLWIDAFANTVDATAYAAYTFVNTDGVPK